jgi:hypothetical protein
MKCLDATGNARGIAKPACDYWSLWHGILVFSRKPRLYPSSNCARPPYSNLRRDTQDSPSRQFFCSPGNVKSSAYPFPIRTFSRYPSPKPDALLKVRVHRQNGKERDSQKSPKERSCISYFSPNLPKTANQSRYTIPTHVNISITPQIISTLTP